MARAHPRTNDPAFWLQGQPSGLYVESFDKAAAATSDVAAALTTQVMTSVALFLEVGEKVTNLSFLSGATAAGTPTNWWFALYDTSATPALIAQTADQTSGAWAADTIKTLALSTAYTATATGIYYAACMVKATTVPSLICKVAARAAVNGSLLSSKVLAQTSGSSLTATAPATIASPTTVVNQLWCAAT
jgi:hypothetical protein